MKILDRKPIENCVFCHHLEFYKPKDITLTYCGIVTKEQCNNNNDIEFITDTPIWCPLEDAEGELK